MSTKVIQFESGNMLGCFLLFFFFNLFPLCCWERYDGGSICSSTTFIVLILLWDFNCTINFKVLTCQMPTKYCSIPKLTLVVTSVE
uniref:Uncharacterized protein n=1 Tax=Rhizophora mucronata TaxID=61149 RepID=A0A2P2Q3K8_RHIMU